MDSALVVDRFQFAFAITYHFFIVVTGAWMQHPGGYRLMPDGMVQLSSLFALLNNPWVVWQYLHTMSGAATAGSVVMANLQ